LGRLGRLGTVHADALLADLPGDWCRDDLLHHIIDWMEQETRPTGYEARETLGAHIARVPS
jgi:hypothetical protein